MEYKCERHENWCYQGDVIHLLSLLLRWLFWARYKELKWNLVVLQFCIWIESEAKTGGVYRIDYASSRSSDLFSLSFTLGLGTRLDFKRRDSFRKYACYLSHHHQPATPNISESFYHVPGYYWFLLLGPSKIAKPAVFQAVLRGIGKSFQSAITAPRINLTGYGNATAQS